jgi:hypothetical protein
MKTALLVALTLLVAGGSRAQEAGGPDWGFTDLDEVELGEQLCGPRLSHYDLRGRVVMCYHWCITCPISTGAFPGVNRLVEAFRDRGLVVIGFHVRRNPDVCAENVAWFLEHLEPDFPVSRLSNDWDWPARILPWAFVYDHEGKRIYGGSVGGIAKVVEEALDRAPDHLVGGPYEKLAGLAARIAADREHAGRHLPALREIAAREGGDPDEIAEARAILASVKRYLSWQMAKAEEDMRGPVEEASVYRALAGMFEGDALGERARERLDALRASPGFGAEEEAQRALLAARGPMRRLPPAGTYAYDMTYSEIEDPVRRAERARRITELNLELDRIQREYPGTHAASEARFLAYDYEMPDLGPEEARTRVEAAMELLEPGTRPAELFDARVMLTEVAEAYLGDAEDVVASEAARLLGRLTEEKAEVLAEAHAAHRRLNAREEEILAEIRRGGSVLPRKEAEALLARLGEAAAEAGPGSRLARRADAFAASLRAGYDGPAWLGAVFDRGYRGPGMRVLQVYARTGAAGAGLARGDVVVRFAGREVESAAVLGEAIAAHRPGDAVKVVVRRGGNAAEEETLTLTLGRRP